MLTQMTPMFKQIRSFRDRFPVLLLVLLPAAAAAEPLDVRVVDRPDTTRPANRFHPGNRPPLAPSPLVNLPFGAIKPAGWLRRQLELEAAGYTGHLTEISPYCRPEGNAWLSPDGLGAAFWEEVPYWFRGYCALGILLDDRELIAKARPWIEAAIASQVGFGYFGPQANLRAPVDPPLPAALFTTPDGRPGLTGEYFAGKGFETLKATRTDPQVDFNWGKQPPLDGLGNENYSVRWTGRLTVPESGDYRFSAYADDGVRLWLDGRLLVDRWTVQPAVTVRAAEPLRLEAGKPVDLRLEFFQEGGEGEVRLGWDKPGAAYSPRAMPDLMPNMNMLFALRAYHESSNDRRVLDLMTRYFKWQLEVPDQLFFAGGWQVPRNGDNMDSVHWLYNRTGEPFLLELAAKLQRTGKPWLATDTGGHNVDFSQGFRKPAQFWQQNHDPKFLQASIDNWTGIMGTYGQVPGGAFGGDEFARPGYTDPRQAIETCGAVEMIISEAILLRITGDPAWADRFENLAYNTLPATTTADLKALRYLTSPNQVNSDARSKAPELADGGPMQVMNPHDHRCCQHNSGAGWPYFTQAIWQATPGDGLAAVSYAPCRVEARAGEGEGAAVTITEETRYPFDGAVTFAIDPDRPARFPLHLRIPGWCAHPRAALNGRPLAFAGRANSYLVVDRTWDKGDRLTLELPMDVSLATWPANHDSVSVNRGPLTFSLAIGESYVRHEPERFKEPWPAWEIVPTTPWNYGLDFDPAAPAAAFEVVQKPWPADELVFSHAGTPVEIRAAARRIPNWREDHIGLVDKLQPGPVRSNEPLETVTMVPMGAARLRLAALPRIGHGPDAREWQPPAEPLTSCNRGIGVDPYQAMFDGRVPAGPDDRGLPRFTTYSFGGAEHGKLHWVRKVFDAPATVSSCSVWWFDESATRGDVRLPKWWKVLYKQDGQWHEVANPSGYGTEPGRFNTVTFTPVTTTELRLDVQTQDQPQRFAMGICEWKIE